MEAAGKVSLFLEPGKVPAASKILAEGNLITLADRSVVGPRSGNTMAELEPDAAQRLMNVFLPEYNACHGTHYDRFSEGAAGSDTDFVCEGSEDEELIKVQHTRAWADPKTEWRHPAAVRNFVIRAITKCLRDHHVTDSHISLNVDRLPEGRKEKVRLAEELWTAIEFGLNGALPQDFRRVVLFNRNDWDQLYVPIKDFVQELEILRCEPAEFKPATVGWSSTASSTRGVLDAPPRVTAAVQKKEECYQGTSTDLVLIVDFEVTPYFDDEVGRIQAELAERDHRFREIWISSPWLPPTAHRVWPM